MEICDSAVLHNDIFINGKRHYIFYSGAHLFCQHEPKTKALLTKCFCFLEMKRADAHEK